MLFGIDLTQSKSTHFLLFFLSFLLLFLLIIGWNTNNKSPNGVVNSNSNIIMNLYDEANQIREKNQPADPTEARVG